MREESFDPILHLVQEVFCLDCVLDVLVLHKHALFGWHVDDFGDVSIASHDIVDR